MRIHIKKVLSCILAAAMVLAFLPAPYALAAGEPVISLGSAMLTGGMYYYANAGVSGDNIRTILISFSDSVSLGDEIVLPSSTPSGFHVSASSNGNNYTKRINLDAGIDDSAVENYLRETGFKVAGVTQSVSVTVTTENIMQDTFYNIDTEHYYQYIPDTSSTWIQSYDAAKNMTYMGRTGYLATIMSQGEDTFVNSLSGGKTGWLGGTILDNSGSVVDASGGTAGAQLYYSSIDTDHVVSTGWYWACGPEIGTTFYNVNSLYPTADASTASEKDALNTTTYYNWPRGTVSYEPNNRTAFVSSSTGDYEACLTTLVTSGNTGKHGTSFSWNDKHYSAAGSGDWDAKGYFVEYGNELIGNSSSTVTAFATDSGTLHQPSGSISLTTVAWTDVSSYTCGINLPGTAEMVTVSVDSGYFTIPSLGGVLNFLGGTRGTSYIDTYGSLTHFSSAVFSFTDVTAAEARMGEIRYTPQDTTPQTITATSSTVSPQGNDLYFEGHYYRYVDSGTASIDWPSSVLAAGATLDPYFGGRGYIATATAQAENSILLRLVENGADGSDHWDDAWMGGLWQRNVGSLSSPVIERGTSGHEITYQNLVDSSNKAALLINYLNTFTDVSTSNPSTLIYANPGTVKYYWIDGPEAGEEIANNTNDFAPWHVTGGQQDEPNTGDFIYIGWEGAYWDDLRKGNSETSFDKLCGYIVEFSGFGGGSTTGVIKEDSKTTAAYSATVNTYTDGALAAAPGSVEFMQGGSTAVTAANVTTGTYASVLPNGTYDIFINNEDTGENITISGAAAGVNVNHYTVSFAAADAGAASGSTVSATAGGAAITSGTAVLAGKQVILTAAGAGASTYTYLWSGFGTSGETAETITIPALNGTVNALCTVTGTTIPSTYAADVCIYTDGVPAAAPGSVELKQGGVTVYTPTASAAGVYTATAIDGTYGIYINNEDTGEDITINGEANSAGVIYYTVSFAAADDGTSSGSTISATAGGLAIASATAVLAGKEVILTAAGAGADAYTYLWSGAGTSGETTAAITIPTLSGTVNALCTVTGTANTFTSGTLEEEVSDTAISAEGLFTQDARLIIIPLADGEANREELESLLSGKQTAAAFEVHIEPADAFKPPLTLSFKVGAQYDGRTVYILHKLHNSNVEQFTVVVVSGEAVITVQELSPFLLTVDPPVTITSQPQSVTVVTGQTATFAVTAAGAEPLTYQWQKRTGTNASWEDIEGAVNPEHTTSQANLSNSGFQYRIIVTDAYERSVTSDAAILTVMKAPEPPATGDRSQPALYMALIILFMLSTFLLLRKRKAI